MTTPIPERGGPDASRRVSRAADAPLTASVGTGWARLGLGIAILAVLLWTFVYQARLVGGDAANFFGYFTNLTCLGTGVVGVIAGVSTILRRPMPTWLVLLRAVAVSCLIVVGVVYNVFAPDTGAAPGWVRSALHIVVPIAAAVDWAFVGDRPTLNWRQIWLVLPYPAAWLAYVLVRGSVDGWVPYGFLLPEQGAASVLVAVLGLLVLLLIAAVLVWFVSRFHGTLGGRIE